MVIFFPIYIFLVIANVRLAQSIKLYLQHMMYERIFYDTPCTKTPATCNTNVYTS